MSFQQKNVTVTLVSFVLLLCIVLFRLIYMVQSGTFEAAALFRLWVTVIVWAVVVTVILMIITHGVPAALEAIRTGNDSAEIDELVDERDALIDLKGTKRTYQVSSLGALIAMLTFALGQSPLVMFSLLIVFGLLAQIVGDITRLLSYRKDM